MTSEAIKDEIDLFEKSLIEKLVLLISTETLYPK
jgi:hypothetical protein